MTQIASPSDDLSRALDAMLTSGLPADEYVSRQPEAAVFAALLRAADLAGRLPPARPQLGPAHVAAGETCLRSQFRAQGPTPAAAPWLRWAVGLALVVAAFVAGAGTASASNAALPGDALYPVKRTVENVRLALTSARGRAALQVELAGRRLDEFDALARAGQVNEEMLAEIDSTVDAAFAALPDAGVAEQDAVLVELTFHLEHEQEVLNRVAENAPEAAQAGLQRAIEASAQDQDRAAELQGGAMTEPEATVAPPTATPQPTSTLVPVAATEAGRAGESPGQTQVPPGHEETPPGQAQKTQQPPGQTQAPGQPITPPGQAETPPGQSGDPGNESGQAEGNSQADDNNNGQGNGNGNGQGNGDGDGHGNGNGNGNGRGGGNGQGDDD